jgi:hypothetical protein
METLLEGRSRMPFYTDLRMVFRAIEGRQQDFNWLITNLDFLGHNVDYDRPPPFSDDLVHWMSGETLTRIVDDYDMQFVWAVLSGFPPAIELDPQSLEVEPFANGNRSLWSANPQIQHPQAEIEVVCWDSSATLLLCHDRSIGDGFRRFFPEAVDLSERNRSKIG